MSGLCRCPQVSTLTGCSIKESLGFGGIKELCTNTVEHDTKKFRLIFIVVFFSEVIMYMVCDQTLCLYYCTLISSPHY